MNANEIAVDATLSKTRKIMLLLALGLDANRIAALVGTNTGVVRNVRAKVYGVANPRAGRADVYAFTRTFGVEIEAHGIEPRALAAELTAAGIECHPEHYNHSTRPFWKVVSDGSVRGELPFELVSPVLLTTL